MMSFDWSQLTASVVVGDPSKPLVVPAHGFGQNVADPPRWFQRLVPGWRFWNFPTMSQILEECRRRNWSCFMPQAPFRDWRSSHARGPQFPPRAFDQVEPSPPSHIVINGDAEWFGNRDSLLSVARKATRCRGRAIAVGFSDGGTLVARLAMADAAGWHSFLVYSGMCPPTDPTRPANLAGVRAMVVRNDGEAARIQDHSVRLFAQLRSLGADVVERIVQFEGHRFVADQTPSLFDWMAF